MTSQALNRPVDVLRKLDWYATVLGKIGSAEQADDLKSIRAAVSELIEAAKESDAGSGGCPCPTCERLRKALAAVEVDA